MRWTGVEIGAPTVETEEAVTKLLLAAGCAGVALSGETSSRHVTSYIPIDDRTPHTVLQIAAALRLLPTLGISDAGEPKFSEIDEEDWANSWKAYFKPLRIGDRLVISPPWEDPRLLDHELLITIDPGMAFGTGTHATTQMCLVLLEKHALPGRQVADIGTGSGILAIAARKLGSSAVTAVDTDPLAVRIAAENASLNGVQMVVQGTFPSTSIFDVVVANIVADTLIAMSDDLAAIVADQGIFIASGVIEGRESDVRTEFEAKGFSSIETITQGEWTALAFRRLTS